MSAFADIFLASAAVPVLVIVSYLCVLAAFSRRMLAPKYRVPELRFDIVVPAHNEEEGVATTVRSLLNLDYPTGLRRVFVIADNCTDDTAERARAAGAKVLHRYDNRRKGKGYALADAFEHCLRDGFADAIVVVDADTLASPNLLKAFQARLLAGAAAVQAHYGVRNPDASWRTRLMSIAFFLFHKVRSLARARLGLSAGLRGNGMCFAAWLLRKVPHDVHSLAEDVEYGIRLGLAGHRVHYADDAVVLGEMTSSEKASRSQRRRWEVGRWRILRTYLRPLLSEAIRRRDAVLLDLALDLLVPPLTVVAGVTAFGLVVTAAVSVRAGIPMISVYGWTLCSLLLVAYVMRGVWLAHVSARTLLALACAPAYVGWKLVLPLLMRGGTGDSWVRTAREHGTVGAESPSRHPRLRQEGVLQEREVRQPTLNARLQLRRTERFHAQRPYE